MIIEFITGFVVGAITIGVIANRRPGWFASLVTMANAFDNQVNVFANTVSKAVTNK